MSDLWQQEFLPGLQITRADTVVDIGCGEGLLCECLARTGALVVGIDIDPNFVRRAVQRMRSQPGSCFLGIQSNCHPIPLQAEAASVVICSEVLEHVPTAERLLDELVRIGKPGARYLLSVPDSVSETVMRIVAPPWYSTHVHPRIFKREQLTAMATAAGLEITQQYLTGFSSSIWWILRMVMGMNHPCDPHPTAPSLLSEWDDLVSKLASMPGGLEVLQALSQYVPKSHVLIAKKAPPVQKKQKIREQGKKILRRLLRCRIGNYEIGIRRMAS